MDLIKRPKKVERADKSYLTNERYQDYAENQFNTIYDYLDGLKEINDYSTEEIQIGTWINNKPIYRKVITVSNIRIIDGAYISHGISNLDEVILERGIFVDESRIPIKRFQFPFVWSISYGTVFDFNVDTDNINFYQSNSAMSLDAMSTRVCTFILEYTKTND